MKKSLYAWVVFLLLLVLPLQNAAALPGLPPDVSYKKGVWTILPHNSAPDDPQRIQSVVDLAAPGDTIRLAAGTFDFSEFENVRIAKNLTIEGAWDAKNQVPLTTILHGYLPILIGRKTPVEKPAVEIVNGHEVFHVTQDVWGKLAYPFAYPEGANYNIHDDWAPVKVNVRQISFERPYSTAVFTGATSGGVIERVHIEDLWPMESLFSFSPLGSVGIGWYGMGYSPIVYAETSGIYDPTLYTGTDLIQGKLIVQDSRIIGNFNSFPGTSLDENGLPYAVARTDSAEPPNGDYGGYVLQDLYLEFDSRGNPVPDSIAQAWVKKGYGAYVNSENDNQFEVETGIWLGMVSGYAQSNLILRRNVIQDCGVPVIFYDNGFKGVAFNALVMENQIVQSANLGWICSFCDVSVEHNNPVTGLSSHADPGDKVLLLHNTFTVANPYRMFWSPVVNIAAYGKAILSGNQINLASGTGIYLGWPASSVNVLLNTFNGTGDYAMIADTGANGNRLLVNNMNAFVPAGYGNWFIGAPPSQVILYSDENLVVGGPHSSHWVALDYGVNNKVIGMIHQVGVFPEASMSRAPQHPYQPLSPFTHGKSQPAQK